MDGDGSSQVPLDPDALLDGVDFAGVFDMAKDSVLDLIVQNLGWVFAWLLLMLAIRFGPALFSWFRHRNDPKQMNLF